MRRVLGLSAVLALLVLLGVAGVGQAKAHSAAGPVCGSSAGHVVIARDAQAEVYRVGSFESEFYGYWGCVYGSKRLFTLGRELVSGSPSGALGLKDVTLVGTTVAYETLRSSYLGNGEVIESKRYVVVLDLRSGRVLHKVPTGVSRHPRPGVVGAGETTAIVVKSNGAVAWINNTVQTEDRFEVHALDTMGERVLAVGSNIARESLALAGSTLYWTQGGKPFSATLH